MRGVLAISVAAGLATAAAAQDNGGLRDFCADRPGLGTPACTIDKGHLQVELGLADWTLDRSAGTRTDTVLTGLAAFRLGVTETTELRLAWNAYGHVRERDGATVHRTGGIGDVTLGIKQSLHDPDGAGLSIALLPFATLPTGHGDVGAGTWGAGLVLPVSLDLSDRFQLEFTSEADAAPDMDRRGRHFAYANTLGLAAKLTEDVVAEAELQRVRDHDPDEHATQMLAGFSLAYMAKKELQLDLGTNAGLNRKTPDVELYLGVSEKF